MIPQLRVVMSILLQLVIYASQSFISSRVFPNFVTYFITVNDWKDLNLRYMDSSDIFLYNLMTILKQWLCFLQISPIPTPVEPAPNSASPPKFLNAICMHCLEGKTAALFCRWCHKQWDGSDLVLGGCYSYDVFAAMPCCHERRQVL